MDEKYEIVRKLVIDYFNKHQRECNLSDLFAEEIDHIIHMGTEILLAKWDIQPASGGFITAFIENKLRETYSNADYANRRGIFFYILLTYNVGMPRELLNIKS